jgi:WbqC-like protein
MKTAIMQPYFLPYIGYFQLIAAVDLFIVYDNIQYTKNGWINRNRIYGNGEAVTISIPLKGASDYLNVCERELAADFRRDKLLNKIRGAYLKAPYFRQTFPLIEAIVQYEESNLFRFLEHCIRRACDHVGVTTEIRVSSGIAIDHALKKQDKVLALCEAVGASVYVNAIGGVELYCAEEFRARGVDLKFIRMKPFEYAQFGNVFVPMLSIIDVMMFNSVPAIQSFITSGYELI